MDKKRLQQLAGIKPHRIYETVDLRISPDVPTETINAIVEEFHQIFNELVKSHPGSGGIPFAQLDAIRDDFAERYNIPPEEVKKIMLSVVGMLMKIPGIVAPNKKDMH